MGDCGQAGMTALLVAAGSGKHENVQLLLQQKVDVDHEDQVQFFSFTFGS